jgi:hypothetical protein
MAVFLYLKKEFNMATYKVRTFDKHYRDYRGKATSRDMARETFYEMDEIAVSVDEYDVEVWEIICEGCGCSNECHCDCDCNNTCHCKEGYICKSCQAKQTSNEK